MTDVFRGMLFKHREGNVVIPIHNVHEMGRWMNAVCGAVEALMVKVDAAWLKDGDVANQDGDLVCVSYDQVKVWDLMRIGITPFGILLPNDPEPHQGQAYEFLVKAEQLVGNQLYAAQMSEYISDIEEAIKRLRHMDKPNVRLMDVAYELEKTFKMLRKDPNVEDYIVEILEDAYYDVKSAAKDVRTCEDAIGVLQDILYKYQREYSSALVLSETAFDVIEIMLDEAKQL